MKLRLKILEKIYKLATAKELDFLIYTLRFQDNRGRVNGLKRADIYKALEIHPSTYYDILRSLEAKGLIAIDENQEYYGFWSYTLLGNEFSGKEDYEDGYINLNTIFLYEKEFLNLNQAEKVICLNVLARHRANRKDMSFTFDTLVRWTGRSLQSVKKYVQSIKKVFGGLRIEGNCIRFASFTISLSRYRDSEEDVYNEHQLEYMLAVKKAEADEEEIKSVARMFKTLKKHGRDVINTAVLYCIDKHKKIIAPYINTMIQTISKDKTIPLATF